MKLSNCTFDTRGVFVIARQLERSNHHDLDIYGRNKLIIIDLLIKTTSIHYAHLFK